MLVPWFLALVVFAGEVTCRSSKIIGGAPTTVDLYPSIVQVDMQNMLSGDWFKTCAGSILTARTILSAAHCFEGSLYEPRFRRIRAGATFRNVGGTLVYVANTYNHPSYGQDILKGYEGDISLVRLTNPLVYSPVIQQTSIPPQDSIIPDNLPVVHAGWGATLEPGNPTSEVLRNVQIYTINNELCAKWYAALEHRPVTEKMICTGILDVGGKGACTGDHGGPMYYGNITIGVVSWGEGCGHATFPGVSVNVASYVDWIIDHTI
ncbi:trypsin, alkaline C-like [Maniola jurtina]|uniref:trypsin, alkaline C-like n=1 Tax=Maniola jurtina TaxID=191418 RepID=UPI001E68BEC3|nr:trypsin, alkaline C-like [Maniola jurtina]